MNYRPAFWIPGEKKIISINGVPYAQSMSNNTGPYMVGTNNIPADVNIKNIQHNTTKLAYPLNSSVLNPYNMSYAYGINRAYPY